MLLSLMGADPTTEGQLATLEARLAQLNASELGLKTRAQNLPTPRDMFERQDLVKSIARIKSEMSAIQSERPSVETAIAQVKRTIALQNATSNAQVAVAEADKAQTTVRENAEAFISQGTTKGVMIAGVVAVLGFLGWKSIK